MGPSVHVPLLSGQPRREADQIIVRFTGAFASLSRYLDKYRDQIRGVLATIAAEELALRFEADESAPTPPPAPQTTPRPAPGQAQPNPSLTATAAPPKEGIPLTPELRAQLEKDPLIRAIMETFSGNIVKVE